MAALPHWAEAFEPGPSEPLAPRPVTVFRGRRAAVSPHYYRSRPLIRLRCPSPPELPPRPSDPPRIHLVAPIPGLTELDDWTDDEPIETQPVDVEPTEELIDDDSFADDPLAYDWIEAESLAGDQPTGADDQPYEDELVEDELSDAELRTDELGKDELVDDPGPYAVAEPTGAPTRKRTPLLITALIVAVLVLLGLTGVLLRRNLSSDGSSTVGVTAAPAATVEVAQATTWLRGNLPPTATVATDATTRQQLTQAGFPRIQLTDIATRNDRAHYALITPSVRAAGTTPGSPLATLLAQALPVAVFGDGAARVEISQLGARNTNLTTAQQARAMAGQALVRNPGLQVAPALTSTIAAGRLDMRAATLLAVLSNQLPTTLLTLSQSGAEARAGAPIRTIELQLTGDPAAADKLLGATVRALSPSLAPYQTSRQPDGTYHVVWLPDLSLTPPAN